MSNGFNPLSMFKPTGNPAVQKLLENRQTPINQLLDQQSFPTEFRRDNHELLEKYMTYKKYETLVQYITQIGDQKDKNRGFKYPFVAAQILSIQNTHTLKYFISKKPIIEQQVTIEEVEVEQQVDSDRSFMSSRSEGSIVSDQSHAEKQSNDKNQIEDVENMPEIEMQKTPSEINQDDFPFIQEVKKVKKVKQKRQRIINHEYQPLINKILDYFVKPFDHTLTGYICKVLNAMLTKNASIYPDLLLKAQSTLFLSHIQSRSTEQLLVRILTYQNQDQNDITFQYNLLMICLHKILDDRSNLVVQNLSFMICEVLTKISDGQITSKHFKRLIKQILRLSFFQKLCEYFQQSVKQLEESKIQGDQEQTQTTELRIKQFAKISSIFLQMFMKVRQKEDFKEDFPTVIQEYENSVNKFTESAYKKLEFQAIDKDNATKIGRFGMTKILLINILFTLIRQNLGFSQQILAQKQCFFQILLQLVVKSPLNSILHNSVFQIFNFFVEGLKKDKSSNDKTIIGSLFRQAFDLQSQYALIHVCYETFKINEKLSVTQRKGYTGHLLNLCMQIHRIEQAKDTQLIQDLLKMPEWTYILEHEIQPQIFRLKTNLGSYTKRKNFKAAISFDRNAILETHKEFLKGTKFSTLQEFQNFEKEEESDSEEDKQHHAGHATISKETEKEIMEMEREQFQMNAGIKNDGLDNLEQTKNSISNNK